MTAHVSLYSARVRARNACRGRQRAGTRRSAAPFGSSRRVAYAALIALGIAVGLATIKWCIAFYYELSPDVMDEAGRRWYHR